MIALSEITVISFGESNTEAGKNLGKTNAIVDAMVGVDLPVPVDMDGCGGVYPQSPWPVGCGGLLDLPGSAHRQPHG